MLYCKASDWLGEGIGDVMNARLLIVDDEEAIRTMLERHFRYLQYDVATAENGVAALKVLATSKCDVLLTDIMMPEMDGVELLRRVRDDYPMVRRLTMTGHVTMANALACIRYGADGCLFKPLTDLTLLDQAVSESVAKIQYWHDVLRELRGLEVQGD